MVTSPAPESISSVSEGGHVVSVGLTPGPDNSSPSDLLLSALGSCIYISLGMAATSLTLSVSNLTVHVTAEKAQSLPHRIDRFDVMVSFDFDGSINDREQILTKTKELCTVSNTLDAAITMQYVTPS
ncbi:MAG: putative OsmC-like protein [Gammaproteobacteria bacterium]|jgi:uncharacterized OsmC-like protein